MLSIIGYALRYLIFGVIVLVLGQVLEIEGKTISDHVKGMIGSAEKGGDLVGQARKKADEIAKNAAKDARTAIIETVREKTEDEKRAPANAEKSAKEQQAEATATLNKVQEYKAQEKAALNQLLEQP